MIELTASPPKLPKRMRARARLELLFPLVYLGALTAFNIAVSSLTWREMLHRVASLPTMMVLVVMSALVWLARRLGNQRLQITPQFIGYSNRLPRWLKFLHADWRIERDKLATVLADLGRGSGMQGYWRMRFQTEDGGQRSISLLGWYRLDRDIEAQSGWIEVGAIRGDYTKEVGELSLVAALRESGLAVAIDAAPTKVPFGSTRAELSVIIACFTAFGLAVMAVVSSSDANVVHPPWAFMFPIALSAGVLAWWALRRADVTPESKRASVVAATAIFLFGAWAGAPVLNGMTSRGYQAIPYLYEGRGVFDPEHPDAPKLDLSGYTVSFDSWQPGDHAVFHLRRGVLGFWQYDRDFMISTIRAKSR